MRTRVSTLAILAAIAAASSLALAQVPAAPAPSTHDYRVLATNRVSTMQKEMSDAAGNGFRFVGVMGGETAGAEVVVVMARPTGDTKSRYEYRLIAASKPNAMQKELQDAADGGFEYRGQAIFRTAFGGREAVLLLERDREATEVTRWQYRVLVSGRTAAMQRELSQAGGDGFEFVGIGIAEGALGAAELVTIVRRPAR
jgi:hypothetical protein